MALDEDIRTLERNADDRTSIATVLRAKERAAQATVAEWASYINGVIDAGANPENEAMVSAYVSTSPTACAGLVRAYCAKGMFLKAVAHAIHILDNHPSDERVADALRAKHYRKEQIADIGAALRMHLS